MDPGSRTLTGRVTCEVRIGIYVNLNLLQVITDIADHAMLQCGMDV